jgi:hypothetical protein
MESIMNWYFIIAAALSFLTAFVHAYFGGNEVDTIIQSTTSLNLDIRAISQIVWHSVTIAFVMMGSFCLKYSFSAPNQDLIIYLLIQILAFSALFIYYNLAKFGDIFHYFQWIIFITIGAFILLGNKNALA